MKKEPKPVQRIAYRVSEAAAALGLSSKSMYDMVRLGHVRSSRIGRAVIIPAAEVERLALEGSERATRPVR